jgi:hypothetical protein
MAKIVSLPHRKATVGMTHHAVPLPSNNRDFDSYLPGEVRTWVPSKKRGKNKRKLPPFGNKKKK